MDNFTDFNGRKKTFLSKKICEKTVRKKISKFLAHYARDRIIYPSVETVVTYICSFIRIHLQVGKLNNLFTYNQNERPIKPRTNYSSSALPSSTCQCILLIAFVVLIQTACVVKCNHLHSSCEQNTFIFMLFNFKINTETSNWVERFFSLTPFSNLSIFKFEKESVGRLANIQIAFRRYEAI